MAEEQQKEMQYSDFILRMEEDNNLVQGEIDSLKNQLHVGQNLSREQKAENKRIQKDLDKKVKYLSSSSSRLSNEKAAWDKRFGSADSSGGEGEPGTPDDPANSDNYQLGDVSDERFQDTYGVTGLANPEVARLNLRADISAAAAYSDIDKLRKFGEDLMSGDIPPDVSEAVQRATSAGAFARGVGPSQLTRNLTARDLGMTSLGLMEKGAQTLAQTAAAEGTMASFEQSRMQFQQQFQLASAELRDAVRRTDLTGDQLKEEKRQFKRKMALALNEQILDMAKFREELQFKFYATKAEGKLDKAKGSLETVDRALTLLRESLDFSKM